jgi:hypothetical protein
LANLVLIFFAKKTDQPSKKYVLLFAYPARLWYSIGHQYYSGRGNGKKNDSLLDHYFVAKLVHHSAARQSDIDYDHVASLMVLAWLS